MFQFVFRNFFRPKKNVKQRRKNYYKTDLNVNRNNMVIIKTFHLDFCVLVRLRVDYI